MEQGNEKINLCNYTYQEILKQVKEMIKHRLEKTGQTLNKAKILERTSSTISVLAIDTDYTLWEFDYKVKIETNITTPNRIRASLTIERIEEKLDFNRYAKEILGLKELQAKLHRWNSYLYAKTFITREKEAEEERKEIEGPTKRVVVQRKRI